MTPRSHALDAKPVLTALSIGDQEDADLYSNLDELAAYYSEHPPAKPRIGSEWQVYAKLLICHWVTALVMLALLVGIKITGVLPGPEQFAAAYDTSLPTVVGQIAIDWTIQPFVALSIQGPECLEGFQRIYFSEVGQFSICGSQGGKPYIEVQRAGKDGRCRQGTLRCSDRTSTANTVCYPEDKLLTDCPIIDIRFASSSDLEQDWEGYTRLDLPGGGALMYTTTNADSRPITSLKV